MPSGDRYFGLAWAGNVLQLEVKKLPGELEYELPEDETVQDEFGEFLNDYFQTTTFTFDGSLSVPGFVEMSGSFSIVKEVVADGSKLKIGARASTYSGTGSETLDENDDLGLKVSGAELGVVVFMPDVGPSSYALTASGGVSWWA